MKNNIPISWLLSRPEPWVRYRTRIDLLNIPKNDPQVIADRAALISHPAVKNLIARASEWPNYPLKRHNDANHPLHTLGVLADFGLTLEDPGISQLVEKVTAHRSPQGILQTLLHVSPQYGGSEEPKWSWMLCDLPLVLHALLAFGLNDQSLLEINRTHLLSLAREIGWPCACDPAWQGFRGPGRKDDPCPYATLNCLSVFSLLPETHARPEVQAGVEMLLNHWGLRKERKYYLFGMGTDFSKLKYPLIWYDLLHVLNVLSRFQFARTDPRLYEMANLLSSQQDADGLFTPTSVWMAWKGWDFAQKKAPSAWLTFSAHRVLKTFS